MSNSEVDSRIRRLVELLRSYQSCVVAFSGGVDSAVVAKAASIALSDNAVAVTGVSDSLAPSELEIAKSVAAEIGIRHESIQTREMENPRYRANAPDRCFYCKDELYSLLSDFAVQAGMKVLANGANADDRLDHRPGMRAATNYQIRSPLADCDLHKSDVREIAHLWKIPIWNKPANPCLASRVAYGQEVTPEKLHQIDQAESFLRAKGFDGLRVRYHDGDMARIEVPLEQIQQLCEPRMRSEIVERFHEFGFKFVCVDLSGFRSGSLNSLIPVEALERSTA